MRKRTAALLLALALLLGCLVGVGAADEEFFVIDENGVLTVYQGPGGDVTIPDGVTMIGDNAFSSCTHLRNVTIPGSVEEIGKTAFFHCYGLRSVTISSGLTSIGYGAFIGCSSLTGVTIPSGVTSIGSDAFRGCSSLTGVTIPNSVTSIGSDAFYGCSSLTSVTIPSSVTSIDDSSFCGCSSLTSVTIPGSVTSIGDWAFEGCSSLTGVTIPKSVTSIGCWAFDGCSSLKSMTIPGSVTVIGDGAFDGCSSLTSVAIPNSVTVIGDGAFGSCSSLTSVTIPGSVTVIRTDTFVACSSLMTVTISNGVRNIGEEAFYGCSSLTSVTIPGSVTVIGDGAFDGCSSLTSVAIPNSVTISDSAFCDCFRLSDVYYEGTETDWAVHIGENEPLTNATIHFGEYPGPAAADTRLDELLSRSSADFDFDLAEIAATLCMKTYEGDGGKNDDSIRGYLSWDLGFDEAHHAKLWSNNYGGSLAYTLAARDYDGAGADKLLVIAVQGSTNPYEYVKDATSSFKSAFQGFFVYDIVQDFYNDIRKGLSHVLEDGHYYKVLLTGHSLGGAAANLTAAILTEDYGGDDIFCYTFGAVNAIASDSPVEEGFENIHNVYNVLDTFSPTQCGKLLPTGMGRGLGKFGHMDLYSAEYRNGTQQKDNAFMQLLDHVNHDMDKYLQAVEDGTVARSANLCCSGEGGAPGRIGFVSADAYVGGIRLNWSPSEGARNYIIQRRITGDGAWTTVKSNAVGTVYEDTAVEAGTVYQYRVRGRDGSVYGPFTASSSVRAISAPGAILFVSALASPGKITVSWIPAPGASAYIVQRRVKDGDSWNTLSSNVTDTCYTDTTGIAGTVYQYRVRGRSGSLFGPFKVSSVVRAQAGAAAPGAISSVTATAAAGKTTVTWTKSANATAYIIQRRVKDGDTWTTLKSNVTGLSYEDTTGIAGTVYQYRVRGRNGTVYGPFKVSSVVRAK